MTLQLHYANPRERRAPLILQRLSLICGIAPAVVGIGCLLGFLLTRWDGFAIGGFLTLLGSAVAWLAGLVLILVYLHLARSATQDQAISRRRGWMALIILLIDIPLAAGCAWAGIVLVS